MHEAMVAQSLLAAISAEAAKLDAKPVSARISYGQLYAVNDEVLRFAFEAVAEGTPCAGVKLEIEHKPLQAVCKGCGKNFGINSSPDGCPDCGNNNIKLLGDAPLLLEEIEFQTE